MTASSTFTTWLNEKLKQLNTDESVFGPFIIGILEDEDEDDKHEALEGLLEEILTENCAEVITDIINKWKECNVKSDEPPKKGLAIDVDERLAKLLEQTKVQATVKERQYTEEEKRIREQILAQYSQTEVSDDDYDPAQSDEEPEKPSGGGGSSSNAGLERNTNALDVANLQKEKREQARMDAAAKKQKDKDDREKQKKDREEKKEKRKTVKGERRR